jgi:FKBP-type peptidyl-prolyl cis-trans isomerase FkpA
MATNLGQRIFAATMAGVFILSACAFSAFVLYDMHQAKKNQASGQQNQQQQQQASKPSQGKPLDNFTPVESVSELQSSDTKVGDGTEAKAGDTVTVDYTGAVASTGKIFESSKDSGQPATLSLDQVIDGWKEGIPGMKVGGTRRLVIPADKAYGANPPQGSGIPANAALVFDVTLHSVSAPSENSGAAQPQQ